ncbi:MAG: SUMF1/EgtB/PvdO family nonheme iron enzyme [Fibrobacteria bacterium]
MLASIRHACIAVAGISSGAFALGALQIENAAVGQRTLVITVDDSIRAPDLSKIRVEGYEIENAVFVEEMGPTPTLFTANYLDLTLPGNGKVVDYVPTPGTLVLDLPEGSIPVSGTVVADTSFGGIFRKVVDVDGQPRSALLGRRWTLKTVNADLPDAVQDCDIAFKTRMDMNQALSDLSQTQDLIGTGADGAAAYGQLGIGMSGVQVLFQPTVTGRIRVRGGNVELFQFKMSGDCDVMATMQASVSGKGNFDYEEELPGKGPSLLSLGSGLFLRMQNRPFLRVEARSRSETFSANADFHIRNSIKGELGFTDGQWRPLAENKMTMADKALRQITGVGMVRFSLKPRVEMLLDGMQGPVFTFEPYARFSNAPSQLPAFAWALGTSPTGASPAGAAGNVYPALPLAPAVLTATPNVPANPAALAWQAHTGAPGLNIYGAESKEMSLGSNIFMEARTNFTGPEALRNFLLFSREQTVFSPPREGTLALKEADSNRISLQCQTYPKADFYIVQQKVGTGAWETILDKATAPKIRANLLKPNTLYRFRALGVNALGISPAFPPEGAPYLTPPQNRPPFQPLARFPDSGAVVSDSLPVSLAWSGGDPDAGAKVQFTVYLDTKSPPLSIRANGLVDSSLDLEDLKPGTTYFWKVIASDGIDRNEGAVRSFTTKSLEPAAPQIPKSFASAYPVVYLPRGSFRREDGRQIQVGPFFLGRYEVTQIEYAKIVGGNPSYRLQDSLPVDKVTWEEADKFCRETGGRLPTEAEWEYAARAGSNSSFYWGTENPGDYAWYRDNSDNRTQKVGLKKGNAWGLHDMAGNVFEWVQDWYGEYNAADLDHPKGPATGTAKVIRGASWYSESSSLSLSARYNNRPGFSNFKVGFRCAKDPERTAFTDAPAALAAKSAEPSNRAALNASEAAPGK